MKGKIYKMPNKRNLSDRINKEEFIEFLKTNPSIKQIEGKFRICRCSIYNLIKKYHVEYNFPKSVQVLAGKAED